MNFQNVRFIAIALLAAVLLLGPATQTADAQTALSTTTLSANITNSQRSFVLGSVSGITAFSNAGAANGGIGSPSSYASSYLMVDKEVMLVVSVNSTAVSVTVNRGFMGTATAAHNSSAVVTLGPSVAFKTQPIDPSGQCVRSTMTYVPFINVTTGHTFDCLGVTTAGQWFQTNGSDSNTGLVGSTVASATTITPTALFFPVSGTTAIATITVPAGLTPGMVIAIRPTGIFATTTAGNIGLVSSASVVGRILYFIWDGSKFWPSYVS